MLVVHTQFLVSDICPTILPKFRPKRKQPAELQRVVCLGLSLGGERDSRFVESHGLETQRLKQAVGEAGAGERKELTSDRGVRYPSYTQKKSNPFGLLFAEREGHKILEFAYRNSLIISTSICQKMGIFQGFSFLYRATFWPLQQYP